MRRLLQITVAVLSLVPIVAGAAGVVLGPELVGGVAGRDLDSHFRYLSGVLLAVGLVFLATVPRIERRAVWFRLAAALVVCGGVGRLLSLAGQGTPSAPHLIGLVLELVVVPLLVVWQAAVARAAELPSVGPAEGGAPPFGRTQVTSPGGDSPRPSATPPKRRGRPGSRRRR